MHNNIARMTSAGDDELKLALEVLAASIPIITLSRRLRMPKRSPTKLSSV